MVKHFIHELRTEVKHSTHAANIIIIEMAGIGLVPAISSSPPVIYIYLDPLPSVLRFFFLTIKLKGGLPSTP